MNCYHMTSLNNLHSISKKGLIPGSGVNSKLIGDEKIKTFFSEGFEGAIALYVDFQIVYDKVKAGQVTLTDEGIKQKIMKSKSLSDYLGDGVYLRFDGANIKNERNFENGCTDMTIPSKDLTVCVLRKNDHSIVYSRFEIIKYMMATVQPEQIQYCGAKYDGAPDFEKATKRIQEKVRMYYKKHQTEIKKYNTKEFQFVLYELDDFVKEFIGRKNMTVNEMEKILVSNNIKYELIKQEKPILSVRDAAEYYPIEKAAPTFVLQTEKEMIACIVSEQNGRLDLAKLKQQFGFSKLKMADAKKIKQQTGYEIGSIPLVGLELRCIFDKKLLKHDYVYGGTGDMLTTLKIVPGDLLKINEVIGMFE